MIKSRKLRHIRTLCLFIITSILAISCESNLDIEPDDSMSRFAIIETNTKLSKTSTFNIEPQFSEDPVIKLTTELLNDQNYREAITAIIEGVVKVHNSIPVNTPSYKVHLTKLEKFFENNEYEQSYSKEDFKTALFYSIRELSYVSTSVSNRDPNTIPQQSSILDYGIFAYGRDRDCSQFDDSDLGIECCKKITCDAADCMETAQDIFIEEIVDDLGSWGVTFAIATVTWVVTGALNLTTYGLTSAAGAAVSILITNTMRKLFGLQGTPIRNFASAMKSCIDSWYDAGWTICTECLCPSRPNGELIGPPHPIYGHWDFSC